MYSTNNRVSFYIESIDFKGDRDLNNYIESTLTKYNQNQDAKKLIITAFSTYEKATISKNVSGDATEYQLTATVEFNIKTDLLEKNVLIKEIFNMKNFTDEFEESTYEKTIKKNFSYSISNKLIMQLSKM
tara:strand:+ start:454 stop:843 length:390 start_codon:yes stop_codon:yes gene_type:complete